MALQTNVCLFSDAQRMSVSYTILIVKKKWEGVRAYIEYKLFLCNVRAIKCSYNLFI